MNEVSTADREYLVADDALTFNHSMFSAKEFAEKLNELLMNPKYSEAMMVMKTAGVAAGGTDRADKAVRDYYLNSLVLRKGDKGPDHLIEHDYIKKNMQIGPYRLIPTLLILYLILNIMLFGHQGIW
jgi:hypothetical protein